MSTESLPSRSLTRCQREWLAHLQAWRQQGGSLKAYAARQQLSLSALYAARRSLTQRGAWQRQPARSPESNAAKLVPVRLTSAPLAATVMRVLLPNGTVVEIPQHTELERCRALLGCVVEVSS